MSDQTTVAEQCPACQGGGMVIVGEYFVTEDMASDAGEPSMAGMHYGFEWGPCAECGGTGLILPDEKDVPRG
jgi:hypothetical protein